MFCGARSQLWLLHFTGKKQLPGAPEPLGSQLMQRLRETHYTKEVSHFPLLLNQSIP